MGGESDTLHIIPCAGMILCLKWANHSLYVTHVCLQIYGISVGGLKPFMLRDRNTIRGLPLPATIL